MVLFGRPLSYLAYRLNILCYGTDLELMEDCEDSTSEKIRRIAERRPDSLSPFSHFLGATKNGKCADVRDRIYAVLAMIKDMKDLIIDYRKTRSQLFADTLELMTNDLMSFQHRVSQLQRALEVDASTIHRTTLTLGHDSGRSYKYVLREHAKITRVMSREDCTEVWTGDPKWPDGFVARRETNRAFRKDGPCPRPTKLIFELDKVGLAPKIKVGDQISELLLGVYLGYRQRYIPESQDWYEDIPHCLFKTLPNF